MGRTNVIITAEMAFPGIRVCRGRDWKWETQDTVGGSQKPGTIKNKSSSDGWMRVTWDGGTTTNSYRVGAEGCYDLYLWEDDTQGVINHIASSNGPTIVAGLADWSDCSHIIAKGMKVMVINDTLTHWVKSSGMKIGDIVEVTDYGSSTFRILTPAGALTIDRRHFALPHQGAIGSVFIKHQIKIKQHDRTNARRIQVPRQVATIRSTKGGGGRRICS